ncbi:MAG: cytochrome C oxidase subunit II [Methylococcaceae bacterium]|nr:MAG: cytochrome C oxidase subunit II [Methylococcaceae bacterium]
MHINPLEKKWLYLAVGMVTLLVAAIVYTALEHNIHPPSHVETIDSAKLHLGGEFAEDKLGVTSQADGGVRVTLVAGRYGFYPRRIEVPAGRPVTFRIASMDVLHGVHVPMTNMSTMVVPGYVAQLTTVFPRPGEYPMLCNEYCGMGHDHMWSRLTVVSADNWHPGK